VREEIEREAPDAVNRARSCKKSPVALFKYAPARTVAVVALLSAHSPSSFYLLLGSFLSC
jgi:hypothetical protein